ncbi:MAG TPA: hypothetical protein VGD49_02085 [Longimicrobiales bacterium]
MLSGFAALITHRRPVTWYGPFVLWGLFLLLFCGWEWWLISRWRSNTSWTFALYFFISIRPSLLYFATHILIPDFAEMDVVDLKAHFAKAVRWVGVLFAIVVCLGFVDTALKGTDYLMRLLPRQTIISGTAIMLSLAAAHVRSGRFALLLPLALLILYFTASVVL